MKRHDLKILHLTLTKKWFDLTALRLKAREYRIRKPYWINRLLYMDGDCLRIKTFDEIHYTNGYGKNRPFCRVKWNGMSTFMRPVDEPQHGEILDCEKSYFIIYNGPVLETRNWKGLF